MALRIELAQKQTQKLILSPQMQQAIHILQLPIMDLRTMALEELNMNPVLEEIKAGMDAPAQTSSDQNDAPSSDTEVEFKEEFNKLLEIDNEWRDYFRQANSVRKYSPEEDEKRRYFEDSIRVEESLQDYLIKQLNRASLQDKQKEIAEHIIGNIDARGYLISPSEEIANTTQTSVEEVEEVLTIIQGFDPAGIGARTLEECLLLQLERNDELTDAMEDMVNNHLEDLSKKKFAYIAKRIRVSLAEVQAMTQILSRLEPKPGRFFSQDKTHYIIPDVMVEKIDEEYKVRLTNEKIPHLRISNTYRKLMEQEDIPDSTKNYIKDKLKAGLWFIKNINQRQSTILNIASRIVEEQEAFLEEGTQALRPMTMQQIADKIGIHESTVSRAIANKYIQTPQGLFPIKYFFTTAIDTFSGTSVSAQQAKEAVADLVKNEDTTAPLSDQEIVRILCDQNIKLARRTVAKYRKELGILPSNMRKSF